ncbi:MAG: hypothetical protein J6333_10450 [Planctomycetes bacterium]|nr:hypothetical protein [Planctomycetota bacterium]
MAVELVSTSDLYTSSTKETMEAQKYAKSSSGFSVSSDQFLMLLCTQMSNQDPMEPMSNSDMMAQYAQLQQLENQQVMTSSMTDMRREYAVQGASQLLGKQVTATDRTGAEVTGVATKVIYDDDANNVNLQLSDGTVVSYTDVTKVEVIDEVADVNASAEIIGKFVTGVTEDAKAYSGIVKNVTSQGDMVYIETYDGVFAPLDGVAQVRDATPAEAAKLNAALSYVDMYVEAQQADGSIMSGIVSSIYSKDGQYWAQTWGGQEIYIPNISESRNLTTAEMAKMEKAKGYVDTFIKANGGKMAGICEGFFYKDGDFYLYTARGEAASVDSVYYSRNWNNTDGNVYGNTNDISAPMADNMQNYVKNYLGTEVTSYTPDMEEMTGTVNSVYYRNGMIMLGVVGGGEMISPYSLVAMGSGAESLAS